MRIPLFLSIFVVVASPATSAERLWLPKDSVCYGVVAKGGLNAAGEGEISVDLKRIYIPTLQGGKAPQKIALMARAICDAKREEGSSRITVTLKKVVYVFPSGNIVEGPIQGYGVSSTQDAGEAIDAPSATPATSLPSSTQANPPTKVADIEQIERMITGATPVESVARGTRIDVIVTESCILEDNSTTRPSPVK